MSSGSKTKRYLGQFLRTAVSLGLIAVVFFSLDMQELRQSLAGVSLLTIAVMVSIDLALRLFSALRWYVLFRPVNEAASLREITRITFIASFFGQALPGVIGVEALRVYSLARSRDDWGGAFASVVADRVFGLISLGLMVLIGILIGPRALQSLMLTPLLVVAAMLLVLVLAAVIPASRRRLESAFPSAFISRLREWIDKVYHCFDHYKTNVPLMAYSLVLALVFQFARVLLFYVAALMLGYSPDFIYFVAIVPAVMFAALLPISIGGLGVREAGLVYLFTAFAVMESAPTFTIALLVFFTGVLSTLPGGLMYVRNRQRIAPALKRAG